MADPFKLRNVYVCWLVVKSKNSFCLPKNVCAISGVQTSLLGTRTRWPTINKWDMDRGANRTGAGYRGHFRPLLGPLFFLLI